VSTIERVALRKRTKVDLIAGVGLFAGCSKKELEQIAAASDELSVAAGAVLMREGERGREFVVIVDGEVDVTQGGKHLRTMGPGEFAGEIALVADVPRTATVTATGPLRILVLSDNAFQRLIRETPTIAAKVLAVLGERLHATAT
jgi:CRP/FNR family cyclic AMP-dependent transcriptional regulator